MASDSLSFASFRTVSSYSKKFSRLNRLRRVFTVLMIAMLLSNPAAAAMVETRPDDARLVQELGFG